MMLLATEEGRVDDHRADEVRQEVRADDPPVRGAGHAGGLDELLLAQRQHLAAHDARRIEPAEEREHRGREREDARREEAEGDRVERVSLNAAEIAMISSRPGNAMAISVRRETTVSTHPRK